MDTVGGELPRRHIVEDVGLRDLRATDEVVESFQREYLWDKVVLRSRPMVESMRVRRKLFGIQMAENWEDGRARLWNSPFDFPLLVVLKVEVEVGRVVMLDPE